MTVSEELRAIIRETVEEAMDASRKEFWVDAQRHWADHEQIRICREHQEEWRKNHDFVKEVRDAGVHAKRAASGSIVVAFLGFLWWSLRHFFETR